MPATLRAGITGCGFIGGVHANAIMESGIASVAGVYDIDRTRADAFAESLVATYGSAVVQPVVVDSFQSLLKDVDAVFVCLPPFAHSGEVAMASEAGVHVFVEKPIALTADRALDMAEAAEKGGIVNQVGYMMRFSEAVKALDELIENGTAGKPQLFQADYSCNALHAPWWRDGSKSGGQIFEQVIHLYDMALHFLGTPVGVSCARGNFGHSQDPTYTIEDTSSAVIQFGSGAIASISASNCGLPGRWEHRFKLTCENVVAVVENGNSLSLTWHNGKDVLSSDTLKFTDNAIAAEDRAFFQCILDPQPALVPLRVGYHGVKLVEAAVRSQGNWMVDVA